MFIASLNKKYITLQFISLHVILYHLAYKQNVSSLQVQKQEQHRSVKEDLRTSAVVSNSIFFKLQFWPFVSKQDSTRSKTVEQDQVGILSLEFNHVQCAQTLPEQFLQSILFSPCPQYFKQISPATVYGGTNYCFKMCCFCFKSYWCYCCSSCLLWTAGSQDLPSYISNHDKLLLSSDLQAAYQVQQQIHFIQSHLRHQDTHNLNLNHKLNLQLYVKHYAKYT